MVVFNALVAPVRASIINAESRRAKSGLSVHLVLYILLTCAGGAFVLAQEPVFPLLDPPGLAVFLVLGGLAQLLPIRFSRNATVSLSMAVALAAILTFGPVYAACVNLASGIVHYCTMVFPRRKPFYRSAVTTSTFLIAAWASGQLYLALGGRVGVASSEYTNLLPLAVAALLYYIINTTIVTEAMALEQRTAFWPLFKKNYQWLTVNVASLTPLGFGIAFVYEHVGIAGLAFFVLPISMAWYSFRLYGRSIEEVRKANDELKEANDRAQRINSELVQANERAGVANQELIDANERLNVMYEISRSLVGSLRVEDTLNSILAATRTMGFPAGLVAGPLDSSTRKILHWQTSHPAFAQWQLLDSDKAGETSFRRIVTGVVAQPWFRAHQTRVLDLKEAGMQEGELPLVENGSEFAALRRLTLIPVRVSSDGWGIIGLASQIAPDPMVLKELQIFRSMAESALEMAIAHEQTQRDALIDTRTGLYNHRYFQESLQRELQIAAERDSYLSFLMIDIDKFKEFNDTYGHQVGDQVLQIVAQLLRENIRETDIACRYGGDELCVLLPHADRARAMEVGARIDRSIRNYPFSARRIAPDGKDGAAREAESVELRVSIGVATFPEAAQTRAGLVEQADRACYRAKLLGGGVASEVGKQESKEAGRALEGDKPKLQRVK